MTAGSRTGNGRLPPGKTNSPECSHWVGLLFFVPAVFGGAAIRSSSKQSFGDTNPRFPNPA